LKFKGTQTQLRPKQPDGLHLFLTNCFVEGKEERIVAGDACFIPWHRYSAQYL